MKTKKKELESKMSPNVVVLTFIILVNRYSKLEQTYEILTFNDLYK